MKINFQNQSYPDYHIIHFILPKVFTPDSLKKLEPPDPVFHKFAHKGVVLSGRGPIWLYGFLIHFYHPTKWVATYDPRLELSLIHI